MIITISGAACTGKTTLLHTIKSQFANTDKRIHYYEEFIRTLFADHYSNKYSDFADLLKGDPMDIINLHKETARLFNEILWSSNLDDILVFDRSPLDISIYMFMNLTDHLTINPVVLAKYREASKYIYRCSSDFMNHNPIIFYARPFSTSVEDDGFRPTSLISRRALELSLFDKEFLSLPDVHVLPSSLGERLAAVKSVLVGK